MNRSSQAPAGVSSLGAPIRLLETAIEAIATGTLDTPIQLDLGDDHPLGALAIAVNEMYEALEASRSARARQEDELQRRIETIQLQREAIVELSTPVIEVWTGVLTLPVLGTIDAERATRMTRELLEAVTSVKAKLAIIDVTGLESVSVVACDHLLRMARCVELLGAKSALSGMRPQVSRALVEAGTDMSEIASYPNLRAALAAHVTHLPGTEDPRRRT